MVSLIHSVSVALLVIAAFGSLYRLIRGPNIVDRLVALEKAAMMVVGYLLLEVSLTGERHYIDAALALALFSFVLTVFVASYLADKQEGA